MDSLKYWALKTNATHSQINMILEILRLFTKEPLPKDARTLLRTTQVVKKIDRIGAGQLWYNGVGKCLETRFRNHVTLHIRNFALEKDDCNGWFLSTENEVIQFCSVAKLTSSVEIKGKKLQEPQQYFNEPFMSGNLFICQGNINNICHDEHTFTPNGIKGKMWNTKLLASDRLPLWIPQLEPSAQKMLLLTKFSLLASDRLPLWIPQLEPSAQKMLLLTKFSLLASDRAPLSMPLQLSDCASLLLYNQQVLELSAQKLLLLKKSPLLALHRVPLSLTFLFLEVAVSLPVAMMSMQNAWMNTRNPPKHAEVPTQPVMEQASEDSLVL
uniref:Uncharacterized protein n=1 Tax=Anopheles dirus TaxID=7168 RepID=A0A182N9L3_9DIPT